MRDNIEWKGFWKKFGEKSGKDFYFSNGSKVMTIKLGDKILYKFDVTFFFLVHRSCGSVVSYDFKKQEMLCKTHEKVYYFVPFLYEQMGEIFHAIQIVSNNFRNSDNDVKNVMRDRSRRKYVSKEAYKKGFLDTFFDLDDELAFSDIKVVNTSMSEKEVKGFLIEKFLEKRKREMNESEGEN